MIANTFLLAKQAVTGSSILGCCCKDKVDEGGRPGTGGKPLAELSNPFISVNATNKVEKVELDVPLPISYDTLISEIAETQVQKVTKRGRTSALGGRRTRLDRELQIAFQRMYYAEEMEFLVVLLAATEDECYEC